MKFKLRSELPAKRVIVTRRDDNNNPKQEVFHLHHGMTERQIRKAVQSGVSITYFEGDLDELKRYRVSQEQQRRMLSNRRPAVATILMQRGMPYEGVDSKVEIKEIVKVVEKEVIKEVPVMNPAVFKYELVSKGLSVDLAEKTFELDVDGLKTDNLYKEVGKAMKMKGNFSAQSVYDKMRE